MNERAHPDMLLDEVLAAIPDGCADDIGALIMDAVVRCNLLSWGRKDGASERGMIPQLAWQMGRFEHQAGTLHFRHPDSPLPEEYVDIAFQRAEIEHWLRQIACGAQD